MATSDTPKNVINVNDLDLEGKGAEPIRVPAKGEGFITFPSPFDGDAEETEAMFQALYNGLNSGRVLPALKKWLTADDYTKFRKAYPTYRATMTVTNAVVERMEAQFGSPGESDASES